jgi:DNA-binding LacI/PurR family transcriptional regulator
MVFPDIENPFYASVIAGAEEVLQNAGYSLLLANYGEDPERERTQLTTLRAERVAGILFAASCKPSADYRYALDAGIALVAVSRIPDGLNVDLVTVSNQDGARHAVEHLLSLGHRRIGLIDGAVSLSTTRERKAGYEQALRNAGLPLSLELIVHADFFHPVGGYEAVSKLLNAPKKPTAILVVSNNMALGVLQALQERHALGPIAPPASYRRCTTCPRDRRDWCAIAARTFRGPGSPATVDRSGHTSDRA